MSTSLLWFSRPSWGNYLSPSSLLASTAMLSASRVSCNKIVLLPECCIGQSQRSSGVGIHSCMGYPVIANRPFFRVGNEDASWFCLSCLSWLLDVEEVNRVDVVHKTLQTLPEENYQVLHLLTAFLVQVSCSKGGQSYSSSLASALHQLFNYLLPLFLWDKMNLKLGNCLPLFYVLDTQRSRMIMMNYLSTIASHNAEKCRWALSLCGLYQRDWKLLRVQAQLQNIWVEDKNTRGISDPPYRTSCCQESHCKAILARGKIMFWMVIWTVDVPSDSVLGPIVDISWCLSYSSKEQDTAPHLLSASLRCLLAFSFSPPICPSEFVISGFGEGRGQLLCCSVGVTMVSFLPT